MDLPTMYYVNVGFSWFIVLLSLWGFVAVSRHTGQKMVFWRMFGFAWVLFGTTHILTLLGIDLHENFFTGLRIGGYFFMVLAILTLMVNLVNRE